MRTIETTVYTFNELSEDAQQKAIENLFDINLDSNWWQFTYEDAERIGLKITSFDLDRNRHAEGEFILSPAEVAQNILNEHGETCETFKTAQNFLNDWQPIFNSYMDQESENYESEESEEEMKDLEDEFLKSLCEDYSIILQNEYEYLMTDEAIKGTIADSYEFTEDGKPI